MIIIMVIAINKYVYRSDHMCIWLFECLLIVIAVILFFSLPLVPIQTTSIMMER